MKIKGIILLKQIRAIGLCSQFNQLKAVFFLVGHYHTVKTRLKVLLLLFEYIWCLRNP